MLGRLPSQSVDLVLADPPFNVGKDYGETWDDDQPEEEYWRWYRRAFTGVFRVQKNGTLLYVSCGIFQQCRVVPLLERVGYDFVQPLVWFRPNLVGGSRIRLPWSINHEPILLFKKGKRPRMLNARGTNTHDVFVIPAPQSNFKSERREHPTQKPVELYERIISRTPGRVVLDPFAGSGSACVAARRCGRRFIGVEINPIFVRLARRRVRAAGRGLSGLTRAGSVP